MSTRFKQKREKTCFTTGENTTGCSGWGYGNQAGIPAAAQKFVPRFKVENGEDQQVERTEWSA